MAAADHNPVWLSHGHLGVLGTGIALPAPPISSEALIDRITHRFVVSARHRRRSGATRQHGPDGRRRGCHHPWPARADGGHDLRRVVRLDRAGPPPGLQVHAAAPRRFDHDFAAILASGSLLFDAGRAATLRHDVSLDAVDTIIPHQVSGRIGRQAAAHFGMAPERFFVNADRVGNTGSAAIWIALAALRETAPTAGSRALVLGAEATKFMHGGFVYEHG